MTERIHYDDDPAATAATAWLNTTLGLSTIKIVRFCPSGGRAVEVVRRIFRTGYLLGQKSKSTEEKS